MIVRRKYIRDLAVKLLAASKIRGPAVPIESVAREVGAIVNKRKVEKNVSGFLFRNAPQGKPIIGVNFAHHPNRQRFTIAHELGHLLLHASDAVHVDDPVKNRDERSSQGTDVQEIESNLFAAELLMPAKFLADDLRHFGALNLLDEQKVEMLADRYQVSTQAMAVRLNSLGHLAT